MLSGLLVPGHKLSTNIVVRLLNRRAFRGVNLILPPIRSVNQVFRHSLVPHSAS